MTSSHKFLHTLPLVTGSSILYTLLHSNPYIKRLNEALEGSLVEPGLGIGMVVFIHIDGSYFTLEGNLDVC